MEQKRERENTQNEGNEDETDKAKARKIFEQQEKIVDEVLKKNSETKHGKAVQIWAIRKKVIRGKKINSLATAIVHPV